MNKEEQLQRLLRLKRHEQPPEGFAQEFLEKFQKRQRTELVRRSALSILAERMQAWIEGLRRPLVLWGAAAAYAAVMLTLWLLPRPAAPGGVTMVVTTTPPPGTNVTFTPGTAPTVTPAAVGITGRATPIPNAQPPGKRRTASQDQNREPVIGTDEPEPSPAPPLRDL